MLSSVLEYVVHWANAYVIHFGLWMTLLVAFDIYKNGLPEPKKIRSIFESAAIMSTLISIFSSHAQTHIIKHFLQK